MVKRRALRTVAFAATVLAGVMSAAVAGRSNGPQWICSTTTRVKPDKVHKFEQCLRKIKSEYKQAGAPWFVTLETFAGDTSEFTILVPVKKFGDLDSAADDLQKRLSHDLSRCYITQTRQFSTPQTNLEIKVQGAPASQYWIETHTLVAPGKINEYLNWLESDYRPALEKAGVKRYQVLRPIFGAAAGEVVSIRMLNNLGEIDNGSILNKVLSDQELRDMNARSVLLSSSSAVRIVRLRESLSFLEAW